MLCDMARFLPVNSGYSQYLIKPLSGTYLGSTTYEHETWKQRLWIALVSFSITWDTERFDSLYVISSSVDLWIPNGAANYHFYKCCFCLIRVFLAYSSNVSTKRPKFKKSLKIKRPKLNFCKLSANRLLESLQTTGMFYWSTNKIKQTRQGFYWTQSVQPLDNVRRNDLNNSWNS